MSDFAFDEWSDIVPIPQDDGPNPVVSIAYSKNFSQLMDLFRGIVRVGEISERALNLTEAVLDLNAANYTVWQYRRECLKSLGVDLYSELDFMDTFSKENPKNYQIWFHRRAVVEMLDDPSRELSFCEEVFAEDSKNYHAWAHRQWVLKTYSLWTNELEFIERTIDLDIRNNSAWNQRWFYVHNCGEEITPAVLLREFNFVTSAIAKVKNNESAWNYLRGLLRHHPELSEKIKSSCLELVSTTEADNHLALGLLADMRELEGTIEGNQKALELMLHLVTVDKIRAKSWIRRIDVVKKNTVCLSEM